MRALPSIHGFIISLDFVKIQPLEEHLMKSENSYRYVTKVYLPKSISSLPMLAILEMNKVFKFSRFEHHFIKPAIVSESQSRN